MFRLFPFQEQAIKNLIDFTESDEENSWFLLKSPTGSGKTYIGILYLFKMYQKYPSRSYHFYCWSRVGIFQIEKISIQLVDSGQITKEFLLNLKISLIQNINTTMINTRGEVIAVIDEAHHLTEEGATRNTLKSYDKIKKLIGLTGTPRTTFENDGFKKCYLIERSEMFISLPHGKYRPILLPSIENIKRELDIGIRHLNNVDEAKDLLANISSAVLTKETKQVYKSKFVAQVLSKMSKEKPLGKTIIFTRLVAEAIALRNDLNNHGFTAFQVDGDTSDTHLKMILETFKNSTDLILIGDKLINESLDIPAVNTIILIDQTGSDMLYAQWLGRGSRISKDTKNKNFDIIDFRENYETHNEKEGRGGFYSGAVRRRHYDPKKYFPRSIVSQYKANIDIDLLCYLIKDQNEYFNISNNAENSFISETDIKNYLLLLCVPPINTNQRLIGMEPFYQLLESTYEINDIYENILNKANTAPLEVPFVKFFVKPIVDAVYGHSLIEESLQSRDRIDLLILGDPQIIIEFAIGQADEKLAQIMSYYKQQRESNNKIKFQNIIVGTSFEGSSVSRTINIEHNIQFINWFDFFNSLVEKIKGRGAKEVA